MEDLDSDYEHEAVGRCRRRDNFSTTNWLDQKSATPSLVTSRCELVRRDAWNVECGS